MALVSVWITAYNHEKYIAEALDGVLNQQTNFDYEIVLGEDGSTDGTREIVLAYQKKYPGKFKLFLPEKNMGMLEIIKPTFEMCTGKYIAFLDGDDYWTDPLKLQKQVDLMEANPAISFCFHNAKVYYQDTGEFDLQPYTEACFHNDKGLTTEDLLEMGNRVWTLSVVMRNILGRVLPSWYYQLPYPDLGIYYLLVRHGYGKYIDEVMGVYRAHKGGAWTGETDYNNAAKSVKFYKILKSNLDGIDTEKLNAIIAHFSFECLKMELSARWYRKAFNSIRTLVEVEPMRLYKNRLQLLKHTLHPVTKLYKLVFQKNKTKLKHL